MTASDKIRATLAFKLRDWPTTKSPLVVHEERRTAADVIEALLAERDKLAAENARLKKALQGMLEIQNLLDECGSCENEFIVPRVSAARAALKGGRHDSK